MFFSVRKRESERHRHTQSVFLSLSLSSLHHVVSAGISFSMSSTSSISAVLPDALVSCPVQSAAATRSAAHRRGDDPGSGP